MTARSRPSSKDRDKDAAEGPPTGTVEPFKELTEKLLKVSPEKLRRALKAEKTKKTGS